jgi:SAM-dependent methyltransferase
MRQKIALISAYFPDGGHLVDMGCGSGQGTYDLARLFPKARVTGVDISPASISYASERHRAANLDFMIGDIGHEIFPDETVDGIFNSSVLHHVTSFNQFDVAHVKRLLDRQAAQLKVGGLLAIRDFVVPAAAGEVLLQLQGDDQPRGLAPGATRYQSCSTAELFRAFAAEFKSSVHPRGGVPWKDVSHLSPFKDDGFGLSALVDHRSAVEFMLRKDYRDDWAAEILEEYTYFSKAQFEAELSQRGFKILVSTNLYNPWIIKNRFEKRLRLCDPTTGATLAWPATNYLIVGQKVAPDAPMRLCLAEAQETSKAAYLTVKTYRDEATEARLEVCRRPSEVVDIIPWYRDGDAVRVVVRSGYPRPILAAASDAPRVLEDITTSGYVVEPIAAVTEEVSDEAVRSLLRARVGMSASTIRSMRRGMTYFPSPGGIRSEECSTHGSTSTSTICCCASAGHSIRGSQTRRRRRAVASSRAYRA